MIRSRSCKINESLRNQNFHDSGFIGRPKSQGKMLSKSGSRMRLDTKWKDYRQGHTNEPGEPHAEIMAINTVEGSLENVACFVSLEQCSFVGRTPSCASELVERGIRKVFIGAIDPHPMNRGAGIDILKNAGIRVETGILEKEVRNELSEHFAKYCSQTH
ncbi:MAG: pyrimidine deaminase RibD-like protein [Parasphingorhabdus sp.]